MNETRVRTIHVREHAGARIAVCGWIHTIRELGRVAFVVIRDGWGTVQVVTPLAALEELARHRAGPESVVRVEGRVSSDPRASGGVELVEPTYEVLVPIDEPLPVPHGHGHAHAKLPTKLDHAPTVLRDPRRRAVLELAAGACEGFRATLRGEGFTEIHTPRIVGTATEGGANVFALEYFGRPAYLAQSPQLYKQIMVGVHERVFEVGPVFRAEPHATVRHLSEYVSLDVELGFIEDHRDVVAVLGRVLRGILAHLAAAHGDALRTLAIDLPVVPEPMPIIELGHARQLLAAAGTPSEADDLAPAEERWLGQWAQREHGSDLLVVSGYPLSKRPFYTHPDPVRPGVSRSFDLLWRGTELVTGGQRLHRHADVLAALDRHGLPHEAFAGYLEAFRFGMPPHGGFAIGLERFVAGLAGLDNIRLARAFPRDPQRSQP